MSNNVYIQYSNATSAEYEFAVLTDQGKFLDDYAAYLKSGKQPATKYEVFQGTHNLSLVIDFSKVDSVAALKNGGQPR